MYGGGNRIYGLHVIIHSRLFAECGVLDNFRGHCGPRTKTCGPRTRIRTCKLVLEDPRGQGLSSRTTEDYYIWFARARSRLNVISMVANAWIRKLYILAATSEDSFHSYCKCSKTDFDHICSIKFIPCNVRHSGHTKSEICPAQPYVYRVTSFVVRPRNSTDKNSTESGRR